jgi:hypothetical protein
MPPTPGVGSLPSSYQNRIRNDPWFMQQQALLQAQSAADAALLRQRLSQMLVQFGQVPEGYSSPYMDATVPGLAQQNTQAGTSLLARLMKAAQDARLQTVNQLAARGILSSGETGYQLGELALAQKQAEYDARTGVLSQLNELQAGNASAELARKLAEIDAAMAAYGRQSSNPANTGLGGMYPVSSGGFGGGGSTGGGVNTPVPSTPPAPQQPSGPTLNRFGKPWLTYQDWVAQKRPGGTRAQYDIYRQNQQRRLGM